MCIRDSTETGWWIGNTDGTPDHPMVAKGGWKKFDAGDESNALLVRAFVLARSWGVDRFIWYAWDSEYGYGMRDVKSGKPKPIAQYYTYAVELMKDWIVRPCDTQDSVWICKLERLGEKPKWIAWTTFPLSSKRSTWVFHLTVPTCRSKLSLGCRMV